MENVDWFYKNPLESYNAIIVPQKLEHFGCSRVIEGTAFAELVENGTIFLLNL